MRAKTSEVTIDFPNSSSLAQRNYYYYDFHGRFGTIEAPDISSRLYLAAVFCACSTLLPSQRYRATGAEVAMDLVRKCWKNTPLTSQQEQMVRCIQQRAWYFPALVLICQDLIDSANQSIFLQYPKPQVPFYSIRSIRGADSTTEYLTSELPWHCRSSLTTDEEDRILTALKRSSKSLERSTPRFGNIEIDSPLRNIKEVYERNENRLKILFREPISTNLIKQFPIDRCKLIFLTRENKLKDKSFKFNHLWRLLF